MRRFLSVAFLFHSRKNETLRFVFPVRTVTGLAAERATDLLRPTKQSPAGDPAAQREGEPRARGAARPETLAQIVAWAG